MKPIRAHTSNGETFLYIGLNADQIIAKHENDIVNLEIMDDTVILYKNYGDNKVDKAFSSFCESTGFSVEDIKKHKKTKMLAVARKLIVYLMRKYHKLSYNEIGELMNRDHTSVIHNHKIAEKEIKNKSGSVYQLFILLQNSISGEYIE